MKNSYVADDFHLIVNNEFISDINNIKAYFGPVGALPLYGAKSAARPLTVISLMLDNHVWKNRAIGYHFTNLVLHCFNSVLVAFLVFLLVKKSGINLPVFKISFFSGLIFALHPVQAEAVNVASFRADVLSTLFYLVSLVFFILALNGSKWFYLISSVSFVLALFSKEICITLPVVLLLYISIYQKETTSYIQKAIIIIFVTVTAVFLIYFWSDRFSYILNKAIFVNIKDNTSPLSSVFAYISTIFLSFFHYLSIIVWPFNLSFDYLIELPRSAASLKFLIPVIGVLLIGYFIYSVIKKYEKSENKLLFFGLGFSILMYLPVSNIIPLPNTVADRYLYLPMIGISIILSALIFKLDITLEAYRYKVPINIIASVFIVLLYGVLTLGRNPVFKDMYSLYFDAVQKAPDNIRARYNLGLAYNAQEKWREALVQFEGINKLNRLYKTLDVWNFIGLCHQKLGNFRVAKKFYTKVIFVNPTKEALDNFASISWEEKNYKGTAWLLEKSIQIEPDPYAYNNLGSAYAKMKDFKKAIDDYEIAVQLKPDYTEAWLNLIDVYQESGNKKKAEETTSLMAGVFAKNKWPIYDKNAIYGSMVYEK